MPLLPHPVMLFNIRTAESGKLPTAAKKTSVGCTFFTPCLQCEALEPRSLRINGIETRI